MPDTLKVGKKLKLTPVWSSANEDVATVSQTGEVTAVGPGWVEIYCSLGEVAGIRTLKVEQAAPEEKKANQASKENS